MERVNLKKLHEVYVRDHYLVTISKRFAALQNLDNRAWENITDYIKTSPKGQYKQTQHKPWFDKFHK